MEGPSFEEFSVFLPRYLNPDQQKHLFDALKQFPGNKDYYLTDAYKEELLQADGWRGFVAINFDSGERRTIAGLVLSNSCDVDLNNARDGDPNIVFAPLIKLAKFRQMLIDAGKPAADADDKIEAIKNQKISSIFYLPAHGQILEESMAILDDLHRHPLAHFAKSEKTKLFTLNQFAFYIFLVKLSIHFTRFSENLPRYDESEVLT
jgi:hypothetical protein